MIQVVLQHHPARAHLLERTAELDPLVVCDPDPQGHPSPWRTYRACLQAGANLGLDFVVMQDDCVAAPGFREAASAALAARPGALVAFCTQKALRRGRPAYERAMSSGARWAQLHRHEWCPALCVGWTAELARCCLAWDAGIARNQRVTADDALISEFARACGLEMWATVPSIVQHPDDVRSIMQQLATRRPSHRPRAGQRPTRMAIWFWPGDARELDWSESDRRAVG